MFRATIHTQSLTFLFTLHYLSDEKRQQELGASPGHIL